MLHIQILTMWIQTKTQMSNIMQIFNAGVSGGSIGDHADNGDPDGGETRDHTNYDKN